MWLILVSKLCANKIGKILTEEGDSDVDYIYISMKNPSRVSDERGRST